MGTSLDCAVTETFDNNEFLKPFKNFNITATEQNINECVAIDDENSHLFQEEILEEANLFCGEQQIANQDENIISDEYDPMDVDTTSQRLQARNILDNVHAKSGILEGELSSAEMQAAVCINYGNPQFNFNNIWNISKITCQQQKVSAKPIRQATLTDMFLKESSSK